MSTKKVQPIGNKLIVLPLERKEEKIDSIVIPGTANADLLDGKVIEAAKEFEHLVKVGDTVVFSANTGVGQFYNGKPCVWLRIDEIWGVHETTKASA